MYTIYVDGRLLYAPNLAESGYAVLDPKLKLQLNAADQFEGKIPVNNPTYDLITKLKSVVKIYDGDKRIFCGRVIDDEKDFRNRKKIMVHGQLAYLKDSIARPYTYTGTAAGYFTQMISQHNAQVDAGKRFQVGVINVPEAAQAFTRAQTEAMETWTELKNNLLDVYGGYIMPRYEVENGVEVEYIDYLSDSGGQNGQPIVFAENLLDLTQYIDASEVKTVLVPYGKSDGDTGIRLDIKSVNDGKDYLESATGIDLFGRVVGTQAWDDVTDPAVLKANGEAALQSKILMAVKLTINAVDLSRLQANVDGIRIGQYNRVVSPPHNIDAWYQCSAVTLRLDKIDGSEFSFGATGTTLTQYQAENGNKITQAAISAGRADVAANATANALNIALREISNDYCTNAYAAELEARIAALEGNTNG